MKFKLSSQVMKKHIRFHFTYIVESYDRQIYGGHRYTTPSPDKGDTLLL
jgi:hypothetical protein